MSPYAVPVQRICAKSAAGAAPSGALVKHVFSWKVNVLPRRQHRLFENRLGGVPLSDFTVTLHLQCNLTECGFTLGARHAVNTMLKHSAADLQATPLPPTLILDSWRVRSDISLESQIAA